MKQKVGETSCVTELCNIGPIVDEASYVVGLGKMKLKVGVNYCVIEFCNVGPHY